MTADEIRLAFFDMEDFGILNCAWDRAYGIFLDRLKKNKACSDKRAAAGYTSIEGAVLLGRSYVDHTGSH